MFGEFVLYMRAVVIFVVVLILNPAKSVAERMFVLFGLCSTFVVFIRFYPSNNLPDSVFQFEISPQIAS